MQQVYLTLLFQTRHEVRNPLSAALSAHSFVRNAFKNNLPEIDPKVKSAILEDMMVVESSLSFIDEFLRSCLDMYRGCANRIEVETAPTDLLRDVLDPVRGILRQHDGQVRVSVDCPENLVVFTDCLRLKQCCVNLGRNSVKFTKSGFLHFQAAVVDGLVELSVADSGPGIPETKRGSVLFQKFQTSLDSMSQGTGVGLSLVKNLVELLKGEIYLDENYHSGVPGSPGARFVIKLNVPPAFEGSSDPTLNSSEGILSLQEDASECGEVSLPEAVSVLFVDDDRILRRMFARSVRKVAPSWKVSDSECGEDAIARIVGGGQKYDLIFMDQYMTNGAEEKMLGTKAVTELRAHGVETLICGLSANALETEFLQSGADAFQIKPFNTSEEGMKKELLQILQSGGNRNE